MKRNFRFSLVRQSVLALFVLFAVSSACVWARGSAPLPKAEDNLLLTAADYDGADLELFGTMAGTTWTPKPKGFYEVSNPFVFFSKKSERMTFRENGEVWYKYSGSSGAVMPYIIEDGVITVGNGRLVYDAETDRLTDIVGGRVYVRVGDKPAQKPVPEEQAGGDEG